MNKEKVNNEKTIAPVTETIEEITGQDIEEQENKTGIVINCLALNVRSAIDINVVIATIQKGTEVTISEVDSTDDHYIVTTKDGIIGFCKKEYIKVK